MTCEEFRKIGADPHLLAGITVQERAFCFKHVMSCEDCQKWLEEGVEIKDFEAAMKHTENEDMVIKIADEDMKNPEFRKIVFGR